MLDLMRTHGLTDPATHLSLPFHYTFESQATVAGAKPDRQALDHTVVDRRLRKRVTGVKAFNGLAPSDHRWLVTDFTLLKRAALRKCPRVAQNTRPDLRLLTTAHPGAIHARLTVAERLNGAVPEGVLTDLNAKWALFTSTCKFAEQLLPRARSRKQCAQDYATYVFDSLAKGNTKAALHARYDALLNGNRKMTQEYMDETCALAERLMHSDPYYAHQLLKPPNQRSAAKVKGEDAEARLEYIRSTCAAQLQNPHGAADIHYDPVSRVDETGRELPDFAVGDWSEEEFDRAVKSLPLRKSRGPDESINEFLKLPECRAWMLDLLRDCLQRGVVPDMWRCTRFAMLPKKDKNPQDANGWRYIAQGSEGAVTTVTRNGSSAR
jgi:hypothetical protein